MEPELMNREVFWLGVGLELDFLEWSSPKHTLSMALSIICYVLMHLSKVKIAQRSKTIWYQIWC
jgi:hypothetical protein